MLYKRKIILINKPFQLRFTFFVSSWIVALSAFFPLVIFELFEIFFRYLKYDPYGPPLTQLQNYRHDILNALIIIEVLFVGLTILISLLISHRIAGPLYKLNKTMKDVTQGRWTGILSFRKDDYFKEIADGFNKMMQSKYLGHVSPALVSKLEAFREKLPVEHRPDFELAMAEIKSPLEATEEQQK